MCPNTCHLCLRSIHKGEGAFGVRGVGGHKTRPYAGALSLSFVRAPSHSPPVAFSPQAPEWFEYERRGFWMAVDKGGRAGGFAGGGTAGGLSET